jgi:hypothetical protein
MICASDNVSISDGNSVRRVFSGALTSIWFGGDIKDHSSCTKRFDLKPHAALCLLLMATENATCSRSIEIHLSHFGGGSFDRTEAKIIAEYGLLSLKDNGYIRLDSRGEKEMSEHDSGHYGLGDIQWLLTTKGAKLIVPAYCECKGLDSSHQAQAVKDMLSANKAATTKFRKKTSRV